jgi:hypothetical protein
MQALQWTKSSVQKYKLFNTKLQLTIIKTLKHNFRIVAILFSQRMSILSNLICRTFLYRNQHS